jgi:hypothetical protein
LTRGARSSQTTRVTAVPDAPPDAQRTASFRDASPLLVARMFIEGNDRRQILAARLRAAALAVGLLLAVLPVVFVAIWPR